MLATWLRGCLIPAWGLLNDAPDASTRLRSHLRPTRPNVPLTSKPKKDVPTRLRAQENIRAHRTWSKFWRPMHPNKIDVSKVNRPKLRALFIYFFYCITMRKIPYTSPEHHFTNLNSIHVTIGFKSLSNLIGLKPPMYLRRTGSRIQRTLKIIPSENQK